MIDLYFATSPNVWKICIALHEMQLEHRLLPVDLSKGAHHEAANLGGSPTRKVPVIVDHHPADGGDPVTVFESGAILQYLGEKTGQFLLVDPRARSLTMQWLFWQMANIGPIGGQTWHFHAFAPLIAPDVDNHYARNRYFNMWTSLWQTMERRLAVSDFLAGEYSIADMACFPWNAYLDPREGTAEFPNVLRWRKSISERPAVRAAYESGRSVDTGYGLNEKGVTLFPWEGVLQNLIVT